MNQMGAVFLSKIRGCLADFLFKLADIAGGAVKTGTECNLFHGPIGENQVHRAVDNPGLDRQINGRDPEFCGKLMAQMGRADGKHSPQRV